MTVKNDFREISLSTWNGLLKDLFPKGIPGSAKWTDLAEMSSILSRVGSLQNSNHMFYPDGGGMDLLEATLYDEEPGCLALWTSDKCADVIKPSSLLFESFGSDLEWCYFRLECEPLKPCGVYEEPNEDASDDSEIRVTHEEVVLVKPGLYAPRSTWDQDEYEGRDLPKTAKLISRHLDGGPLVIFAKGSVYNLAGGRFDAYDARHAKMNSIEFREYIEKFAKAALKSKAHAANN